MNKVTKNDIRFDDYTDNYQQKIQESINFSGQDVDFFIQVKAKIILELIKKHCSGKDIKVLDIGSGVGLVDKYLIGKIKNLYGVDVEDGVVNKAIENNPGVKYQKYDGENLPFECGVFDFAFAINVMHHIHPRKWQLFTDEMRRVLKPGGIAVVFEHNPFNPLTRRVVRGCEFDRGAVLLSHKTIKELFVNSNLKLVEGSYILFFPFKGGVFRALEKSIKWLPLGAQQFVI
ncbi:class I SAM-dependent methyltransferase [Candidatus Roizmanbacteria bacterium]|nr:class I SAM-dependent methyltransferase [Candidatus Roizmanbacteria bacterium]